MSHRNKNKFYNEDVQASVRETKIQETIRKSKDAFYISEQERMLSYQDFLWVQLKVIQKRWWFFQILILIILWIMLSSINDEVYLKRSMGVVATIFVILIIPELWKNRSYNCMEIEATLYYSLKQVYAARMFLFGVIDVTLITLFLGSTLINTQFDVLDLVIQFLLPLSITACICFGILCSKYSFSEVTAIGLCILWSAVWLFVVLNERIYAMITLPIWMGIFGATIIFLIISACRILKKCNKYLEV